MTKTANIKEIFSSIQGEGKFIGYNQVFIRFSGCNLACDYCDTDFIGSEFCKVFDKKHPKKIKNDVSTEMLKDIVIDFYQKPHHSISFTGGEPLLNPDFINDFINLMKTKVDTKYFLETNGSLPDELLKVIDNIDMISMDIKLESSTKQPSLFELNKQFIKIAKNHKKDIYVKLVVTDKITEKEINEVANILQNQETPLILQPKMIENKIDISKENLIKTFDKFNELVKDVRIIPQTHKFLGLI